MFYAAANNGIAMKPHILKASRTAVRAGVRCDWKGVRSQHKLSTLAILREGR
jgi:hypothetical protein